MHDTLPLCRQCGYDLSGLVPEHCPECGALIDDPLEIAPDACPACYRQPGRSDSGARCPHCGCLDLNALYAQPPTAAPAGIIRRMISAAIKGWRALCASSARPRQSSDPHR